MPKKANLLVTELFDTELIGEGAIWSYKDALTRLMEVANSQPLIISDSFDLTTHPSYHQLFTYSLIHTHSITHTIFIIHSLFYSLINSFIHSLI